MEFRVVPFYEKFGVLSILMPYYDYTHRWFVLLSELCKGSRNNLIDWYEEFAKIMLKYCQTFYWDYNPRRNFPPCDLFLIVFEYHIQFTCYLFKSNYMF